MSDLYEKVGEILFCDHISGGREDAREAARPIVDAVLDAVIGELENWDSPYPPEAARHIEATFRSSVGEGT